MSCIDMWYASWQIVDRIYIVLGKFCDIINMTNDLILQTVRNNVYDFLVILF